MVTLINFHLFHSVTHPLSFGYPWLIKHNLHINWTSRTDLSWGPNCKKDCFPIFTKSYFALESFSSHAIPDVSLVPECYHDSREVFSKSNPYCFLVTRTVTVLFAWKATFNIPIGYCENLVMPFCLPDQQSPKRIPQ